MFNQSILYTNRRQFDLKLPVCSISSWDPVWHEILLDSTMSGKLPTSHKSKLDATWNVVIIRYHPATLLLYCSSPTPNECLTSFPSTNGDPLNLVFIRIDRNYNNDQTLNRKRDGNRLRLLVWANTCRHRQLRRLPSSHRSIDVLTRKTHTHTPIDARAHAHRRAKQKLKVSRVKRASTNAYIV